MILVTLGTIPFQFNRPLIWIDILIERSIITEPMFVQYGYSDPSILAHYPIVTLKPMIANTELISLAKESHLVISHAGQGSTRMLAEMGVPFVLLPRLKVYKEHIDDHQLWFAKDVEHFDIHHCSTLESLEQMVLNPPPPVKQKLFDNPKLSHHLANIHPPQSQQTRDRNVHRRLVLKNK